MKKKKREKMAGPTTCGTLACCYSIMADGSREKKMSLGNNPPYFDLVRHECRNLQYMTSSISNSNSVHGWLSVDLHSLALFADTKLHLINTRNVTFEMLHECTYWTVMWKFFRKLNYNVTA